MIKIFYMDEGIIYEEGTPEEIFENPKKDKTLQFVKKLFVLEEEILTRFISISGWSAKRTA